MFLAGLAGTRSTRSGLQSYFNELGNGSLQRLLATMNHSTSRISILHFAIGTLVLALILRTWLVLGLIEPVTVAGSSMVPTLRGPHVTVACEKCGNRFEVGAEFETERVECLRCGYAGNSLEGLAVERADHLLIDRTAFQFRQPRRWEPVVFRSPEGVELTVKRVVGTSGEEVQLFDGDVWIDGKIATKDLPEMRALRQLVHEETNADQRWYTKAGWLWHGGAWRIPAHKNETDWRWLSYQHPDGKPIVADTAYNAGLTQRIFPVHDLALSAKIHSTGKGSLILSLGGNRQFVVDHELSGNSQLEVYAFDHRIQVLVDGKLVENTRADSDVPDLDASRIAIGAKGLGVALKELRVYCDTYHASQNEERGVAAPMTPIVLGPREIFVLGDNVPVSLDSRLWGPVPLKLLVGKPVGVR